MVNSDKKSIHLDSMIFHNAPSKDIFGMTEGERVKHIWGSIKFKNYSTYGGTHLEGLDDYGNIE